MAKKTLPILITAAALLGFPSINAECQNTASHQVNLEVCALRAIYVDSNDEIFGIGFLSDGVYFPEEKIDVFKAGSKIPMNKKIENQYLEYLNNAEKYGIDWSARQGWHYYAIITNSTSQTKNELLYDTVVDKN